MNRDCIRILFTCLLLLSCQGGLAQRVVLGGNPLGSQLYPISQAISTIVSENSPLRVDVLPQGGSVLYPMMQTEEVDFALVNPMDALSALKGEGLYDRASRGQGFPMLTLMLGSPIALSIVAAADSGVESIADLVGRKVVTDYGAFASAGLTAEVVLATEGITIEDIDVVTVSSYPEGVRAVIEGRADASTGSVGSSIIRELDVARGARFLPVTINYATRQVIRRKGQAFYPLLLEQNQPGVNQPTWVIAYDIPIVVRTTLDEEVAYEFVKAVWENHSDLARIYAPLATWTPDRFVSNQAIIPYHPGAIRYYREQGVWSNEMENHNNNLIEILQ